MKPPQPQSQPQPQPHTSVNETLAYGMVNALYSLSLAQQDAIIRRTPSPAAGRRRRPSAFRENVRWFQSRNTPAGLLGSAFVAWEGDRLVPTSGQGTDKHAVYVQLFWVMQKPHQAQQRPYLQMELLTHTARRGASFYLPLLRVSRHALMRLYRRLGTTDHSLVQRELNHLGLYYPHLCMLIQHAVPGSDIVWILRSLNGVFLITRDASGASLMVAKTWLSNRRLEGSALGRKLASLPAACQDPLILKDMPVLPMVSLHDLCGAFPAPPAAALPMQVYQALSSCYPPGRALPPVFSPRPIAGPTQRFAGMAVHPPFPFSLLLPGTLRLNPLRT